MSDRVCQFFLRGRCQRANCEFKHPADRAPHASLVTAPAAIPPGVCRFYLKGHCKFGSTCRFKHEDPSPAAQTVPDSEQEAKSEVPEKPQVKGDAEVDKGSASPKPAASQKDQDDSEQRTSESSTPLTTDPSPADIAPPQHEVTPAAEEVQTSAKADPSTKVSKPSFNDTSTFLAATTSETTLQQTTTTPLTRRAHKPKETSDTAKTDTETAQEETAPPSDKDASKKDKTIRRDSKGFERFEDYFSDSEADTSTNVQEAQPETESKAENKSEKEPESSEVVPVESVPEVAPQSDESDVSSKKLTEKPARGPPKKDQMAKRMSVDGNEADTVTSSITKKAVTVEDLSKEWDEEGAHDKADTQQPEAVRESENNNGDKAGTEQNGVEAEETIENIESFIQDEPHVSEAAPSEQPPPSDSSATPSAKPASSKEDRQSKAGRIKKEGWVTYIFGQDGVQIDQEKAKKSVYDMDPDEEMSVSETTPFSSKQNKTPKAASAKKKDSLAKKEGVTKIGNNTYYYTGPKQNDDEEMDEEEEEDDEEDVHFVVEEDEDFDNSAQEGGDDDKCLKTAANVTSTSTPTPSRRGRSYAHGRRKHNTNYVYGAKSTAAKTRRCGECEGCNREDCGECSACQDKPKFGGRGAKKQACVYRVCSWKNPDGKRGSGRGRGKVTPGSTPARGRTRSSIGLKSAEVVKRPAEAQTQLLTPVDNVRRRGARRSISVISPATVKRPDDKELPQFDPKQFKPGYVPPVVKKGAEEYHIVVTGVKDTGLCGKYWAGVDSLPSKRRRTTLGQGTDSASPSPSPASSGSKTRKTSVSSAEEASDKAKQADDVSADDSEDSRSHTRGRQAKRKATDDEDTPLIVDKKKADKITRRDPNGVGAREDNEDISMDAEDQDNEQNARQDKSRQIAKRSKTDDSSSSQQNNQNRSVSCFTEISSQREVVVECFAPYEEHRWVNIGKERDNMSPDAVQYARALRPPYHLLSFLRIKGHSTKGMSCTDKNTMVFVVLKGEITVVLHTTQFNAKSGDSFYIPPKNNYNLINQKSSESELSLIQFQYDGPLPTVSAASQSGTPRPAPSK